MRSNSEGGCDLGNYHSLNVMCLLLANVITLGLQLVALYWKFVEKRDLVRGSEYHILGMSLED